MFSLQKSLLFSCSQGLRKLSKHFPLGTLHKENNWASFVSFCSFFYKYRGFCLHENISHFLIHYAAKTCEGFTNVQLADAHGALAVFLSTLFNVILQEQPCVRLPTCFIRFPKLLSRSVDCLSPTQRSALQKVSLSQSTTLILEKV